MSVSLQSASDSDPASGRGQEPPVPAGREEPRHYTRSDASGVLREIWEYRELFYFLAWRDIKVRYKQTSLGVLWAVIQPLLTMLIFTVLFGRFANVPSEGLPRPLFYFSALLPWTYVSTTVNTAAMSLVGNSNLLTKIYFPRIILPISASLSGLLDFAIGVVMLAVLLVYFHIPLGLGIALWPALICLMAVLAVGIGTFLAAVNVKFRDVKYAIPFAIQIWLFVTPIIYPTSIIPERLRWLVALNPLAGIVEAFRSSLTPGAAIDWTSLGTSCALSVSLLLFAVIYFKRTERAFADIV